MRKSPRLDRTGICGEIHHGLVKKYRWHICNVCTAEAHVPDESRLPNDRLFSSKTEDLSADLANMKDLTDTEKGQQMRMHLKMQLQAKDPLWISTLIATSEIIFRNDKVQNAWNRFQLAYRRSYGSEAREVLLRLHDAP